MVAAELRRDVEDLKQVVIKLSKRDKEGAAGHAEAQDLVHRVALSEAQLLALSKQLTTIQQGLLSEAQLAEIAELMALKDAQKQRIAAAEHQIATLLLKEDGTRELQQTVELLTDPCCEFLK